MVKHEGNHFVIVVSWIAFILTSYNALTNLAASSEDPDYDRRMWLQGIFIGIGCASVWMFKWNKIYTPITIPVSALISNIIIGGYIPRLLRSISDLIRKAFRD